MVKDAVSKGAKLLLGGKRKNNFYPATILDYVKPTMDIVVNETFGPIAPIIRVNDLKEAIDVGNSTKYGLQAGIMTSNINNAIKAAKELDVGAVIINDGPGFRAEHLPFGGVKDSGCGREGIKYAIQDMTKIKTIVI